MQSLSLSASKLRTINMHIFFILSDEMNIKHARHTNLSFGLTAHTKTGVSTIQKSEAFADVPLLSFYTPENCLYLLIFDRTVLT